MQWRWQSLGQAWCWLLRVSAVGRKIPDGYAGSRQQIGNRYANPHERARTLLVLQGREIEQVRRSKIGGIHDPIAERKKCGQYVAR